MRIDKPWGYEDLIFLGPKYVFKKLFMLKGESCSLQLHERKHETVLVFSGQLRIEIGSIDSLESKIFGPGESVVIEPGVVHRMTALEESVYFEASTPELDDVVRIQDKYGREDRKT